MLGLYIFWYSNSFTRNSWSWEATSTESPPGPSPQVTTCKLMVDLHDSPEKLWLRYGDDPIGKGKHGKKRLQNLNEPEVNLTANGFAVCCLHLLWVDSYFSGRGTWPSDLKAWFAWSQAISVVSSLLQKNKWRVHIKWTISLCECLLPLDD